MNTLWSTIGVGLPIVFVAFAAWCFCRAAADGDMNREWDRVQKEAEQERIRQAFLNSPARRRAQ